MNSIFVLHPYKYMGMWVFDDSSRELHREPFISGSDKIIDGLVSHISDPQHGFIMLVSDNEFPNYNTILEWQREEYGGNWYRHVGLNMEGWLCPALLKFFDKAPKKIYVQIRSRD